MYQYPARGIKTAAEVEAAQAADLPLRRKIPEGLMQAAMGAGMAMIWAALLGAWLLGVI